MQNWEKELKLAAGAARSAGGRLREIRKGEIGVISAAGRDIKTQADRDAEAIILEALKSDSDYPILAEESGEHGVPATGPFWVVDPLDGTMNYAKGWDLCCVSIALVCGGEPVAGVIYDFNRDELFMGAEGVPATLNGAPVRTSGVDEMAQAVLYTGFPLLTDLSDAALTGWMPMVRRFKKVRMLGTSAIGTSWLACGRFDAYVENDVMLWDMAAGLALIKAAGGEITLGPSERHPWARRVRAAANRPLLDAILAVDEENGV